MLERTWARPTLDVHGMPGGFIGAGAKTVIPAKAQAKVSMRLVPKHDARQGLRALQELRREDRSRRRRRRCAPHSLRRRLPDSRRQPLHPGRHARPARGLGQGHGLHPLRRLDSHRRRLRPSPRPAQRHDGLRPARRQPPRPQREVPPEELRAGHRVAHPLPGGSRAAEYGTGGTGRGDSAGSVENAAGFVLAGGQSSRHGPATRRCCPACASQPHDRATLLCASPCANCRPSELDPPEPIAVARASLSAFAPGCR